jgi:hypothetical protein
MGTDAYVRDKLTDQIRTHDARLRALCRMAERTGAAVTHENAEIARQIVVHCLQKSQNSRSFHRTWALPVPVLDLLLGLAPIVQLYRTIQL